MIDWDHAEDSIDTFRSASLKYWAKSEELQTLTFKKADLAWDTNSGVYFNITCSSLETNTDTKFYSFSETLTSHLRYLYITECKG